MPARDELERSLVEIWENELGVRPIGIQENFFELGGHSLLAVRVFARLKHTVGVELPLATFLRAPTIEQLADAIRSGEPRRRSHWRALVKIKPEGSKPPLFCIHAHGGHVLFYRDLAARLDADRPFYALQARGVDGVLEPLTSFEEMAANYVDEIRAIQPRGPYRLGGDCLGGVIALETAQQLRALGDEVALVAMFDSFHPRYRPYLPTPLYESLHRTVRIVFNLKSVGQLPKSERVDYLRVKAGHTLDSARYRSWHWQRQLGRRHVGAHDALIRTQAALGDAFDAYEPKPYDGRVALFRSAHQPFGIRKNPTLGWDGLISQLDVYVLPGYFTTGINDPVVRVLAEQLRRCLNEVDWEHQTLSPPARTAEPVVVV
jgi:thioesterase domain-containing protein/acyl carrier protein